MSHKKIYVQQYDDPRIDQIILYEDNTCEIQFKNGFTKPLPISCDSVYCSQYGIALSNDGTILLFSSWENGLTAYHIDKETVLWHYQKTRITKVFVYSGYTVAIRNGHSIVKLDLFTGEVCGEIRSATIEKAFALDEQYLLIDSFKGYVSIADVRDFFVVKNYRESTVNPNNCLSIVIRDAFLSNNRVVITGFEEYPERNINDRSKKAFERVIDNAFMGEMTNLSAPFGFPSGGAVAEAD